MGIIPLTLFIKREFYPNKSGKVNAWVMRNLLRLQNKYYGKFSDIIFSL